MLASSNLMAWLVSSACIVCFFFNDTATTEIYTLSLHDALPIFDGDPGRCYGSLRYIGRISVGPRSEEHTSELQSRSDLVCRLLLEKKKARARRHPRHRRRRLCRPKSRVPGDRGPICSDRFPGGLRPQGRPAVFFV